jgi:hypothetical protein
MEKTELHRLKQIEVDTWDALLRLKVREYVAQGFSCNDAEEKAAADVRREIRRS